MVAAKRLPRKGNVSPKLACPVDPASASATIAASWQRDWQAESGGNTGEGQSFKRGDAASLEALVAELCARAGVPAADPARLSNALVDADLRGVHSHGCRWVPAYFQAIREGSANVRPEIRTIRDEGATVLLDADAGLGHVVVYRGMELAVERAKRHGTGTVVVRRSGHCGALAYYTQLAADSGCLGYAATKSNWSKSGESEGRSNLDELGDEVGTMLGQELRLERASETQEGHGGVWVEAQRIVFAGERVARLESHEVATDGLGPTEIVLKTQASLISAGTELATFANQQQFTGSGARYPSYPGYAAVGRVVAAGAEAGFREGDLVFAHSGHVSLARIDAAKRICVHVPDGLEPERGVVARLACVSMTTMRTTVARPGDEVAVVGLGLVGNLATQVFRAAGMRATGLDLSSFRREVARRCGAVKVLDPAADLSAEQDRYHLVIEASGRAAGAITTVGLARTGAEVVLVGTTWLREASVPAWPILQAVFRKYLRLRSGWEWELPHFDTAFRPGSLKRNAEYALELIAADVIHAREVITHVLSPSEAQHAYEGLLDRKEEYLGVVFRWE